MISIVVKYPQHQLLLNGHQGNTADDMNQVLYSEVIPLIATLYFFLTDIFKNNYKLRKYL